MYKNAQLRYAENTVHSFKQLLSIQSVKYDRIVQHHSRD